MCGILGLSVPKNDEAVRADSIGLALESMRLRGTSSSGAVVIRDGETLYEKTLGEPKLLPPITFTHGVASAHVRYATVAVHSDSPEDGIQPIKGQHRKLEFFVAHNGEISNYERLLVRYNLNNVPSDSALIALLISLKSDREFEDALLDTIEELEGAYTLVIQEGETLYVSRDRAGMRPCAVAKNKDGIFVASETHVFDDIVNHPFTLQPIGQGETIKIERGEIIDRFIDSREPVTERFCSFEGIYMMRNRALYGSGTVRQFRERLGEELAKRIDLDGILVGVPNSGIPFADGMGRIYGKERTPLVLSKAQYERSFQAPTDQERTSRISDKLFLNPDLINQIEGNNIILVDDSIVRGNTSRILVSMIREYNPASIRIVSGFPPVINPCFFGVDLKKAEDFLLRTYLKTINHKDIDFHELAMLMNVDGVHYLPVEVLRRVDKEFRGEAAELCVGCSDGDYPYPISSELSIIS